MPQHFQVLRCYKCFVFQVHQTKKANKFECKLCGEKQSIKRHYGLGTAKDCRLQVQKLNGIRGEISEIEMNNDDIDSNEEIENISVEIKPSLGHLKPNTSKWSEYIDKIDEITETEPVDTMFLNNTEVVLEIPKKIKRAEIRHFKCPSKNSKISYDDDYDECVGTHSENEDVFPNKISGLHKSPYNKKETAIEFKGQIDDVILKPEPNVIMPHFTSKRASENFVPSVKLDSKWAQFVDTHVIKTNEDISPLTSQTDNNNPRDLFVLCDDNDLDNVLKL